MITGATSGIGEALAVAYAKPGVTLALTGRNEAALARVSQACESRGARILSKCSNVTDRAALAAWISSVDGAAPLDLVIANAGVTAETLGLADPTQIEAATRGIFDANVTGVFNTIFPALDGMRARGSGHIAIMSSVASFAALGGVSAPYSASKAAVRYLGEGLRVMLAREGVRVSVICPGYVESPMTDALGTKPRPFQVTMPVAVAAIVSGLDANDAIITFPTPLALMTQTVGALPAALRDWLAKAGRLPVAYNYWRRKRTDAAAASAARVTGSSSPTKGDAAK